MPDIMKKMVQEERTERDNRDRQRRLNDDHATRAALGLGRVKVEWNTSSQDGHSPMDREIGEEDQLQMEPMVHERNPRDPRLKVSEQTIIYFYPQRQHASSIKMQGAVIL